MSRSIKNSRLSQSRGCQNYVAKLHRQIELIDDEVCLFNSRQNRISSDKKYHLKKLSQPKYQDIILQKKLNPEYAKIQNTSKLNNLFKNCSALTQNTHNFYNESQMLIQGSKSKLISHATKNKQNQTQRKLSKKLKTLEKSWHMVQCYREINEINETNAPQQKDKRTESILSRMWKQRPKTSTCTRSQIIFE